MSRPRSRLRARLATALLSAILAQGAACMHAADRGEGYGTATPRAPVEVEDLPVEGHRVWLRLEGGKRLVGELLAVDPEGRVVVTDKRRGDQTGSFADIRRATVQIDRRAHVWIGSMGGATAVLMPMSLVGGYFALVTVPIIGVGGSIAMLIAWLESRVVLKGDDLQYLYQYARWPQGEPVPLPPVGEPLVAEPPPRPAAPAPAPIEPVPY